MAPAGIGGAGGAGAGGERQPSVSVAQAVQPRVAGAEFLDNVKSFACYPYAVATGIDDFRDGDISMCFEPLAGRIDQGARILFNLKSNCNT